MLIDLVKMGIVDGDLECTIGCYEFDRAEFFLFLLFLLPEAGGSAVVG